MTEDAYDPRPILRRLAAEGSDILDWSDARRVRWLSELAEALDALSTTAGVSEHVRTAAAGGHPTRGNPILDGERTYPWFMAGRELNAQGLHAHALAMLRLVPVFGDRTVPVLYETAFALNRLERYDHTIALLLSHPSAVNSPIIAEQLGIARLANGDLSGLEAALDAVPRDQWDADMHQLHAIVDRARRVRSGGWPLDETDLLGWHAAVCNSILIDTFDEMVVGDEPMSMSGRYGWVNIQGDMFADLISGAAQMFALSRPTAVTCQADDPEGEVVGRCLAHALGISFVGIDQVFDGGIVVPGVRVCASWEWQPLRPLGFALRQRPSLADVETFAMWADWTRTSPASPDVVGVLAQSASAPWDSGMRVVFSDPANPMSGTREVVRIPPDQRSPAEIAGDLQRTERVDVKDRLRLATCIGTDARPWWHDTMTGFRQTFPVRTARFS